MNSIIESRQDIEDFILETVPITEKERSNAWGELSEREFWYSTDGSFNSHFSNEEIDKQVLFIRKRNLSK